MRYLPAAFRDHLEGLGIVSHPDDTASPAPPMWVEPLEGVPYGDDLTPSTPVTLGVGYAGGLGSTDLEGFITEVELAVTLRATEDGLAQLLDTAYAIQVAINDQRSYELDDIHVERSLMFTGLNRVATDTQRGEQGYRFGFSFMLLVRTSSLA